MPYRWGNRCWTTVFKVRFALVSKEAVLTSAVFVVKTWRGKVEGLASTRRTRKISGKFRSFRECSHAQTVNVTAIAPDLDIAPISIAVSYLRVPEMERHFPASTGAVNRFRLGQRDSSRHQEND